MLTENQTNALKELIENGNNAGALAFLDGIKNQEPIDGRDPSLAKASKIIADAKKKEVSNQLNK